MAGKPRRGRHRSGDEPVTGASAPVTDPAAQDEAVDPAEAAAEALLADTDAIQRRLDGDLAAVAAVGRGSVDVDPELPVERAILAVREQADRLGFESPVAAAVEANAHAGELPLSERENDDPIPAYLASAGRTVANGEVVREHLDSEGTSSLVFHRRVAEPNNTSVRFEAVVALKPSGSAYLTAYGWPRIATDQPVHSFGGSAEGYAEQVVSDLTETVKRLGGPAVEGAAARGRGTKRPRKAASPAPVAADPSARVYFERAMLMAFGFVIAQHRDGYLPQERLLQYQDQILPLVVPSLELFVDYVETAFVLAEQGGVDGWTGACVRRSAVEALFAGFLGSSAFELIDVEILTELHQVIDETAEGLPQRGRAPEGLPRYNHEWWTPPRR